MSTIKTATGREFEGDYYSVIPHPKMAFIRICNARITDLAQVFSDPLELAELWLDDNRLVGYTRLVALAPEDGAIKIALECAI